MNRFARLLETAGHKAETPPLYRELSFMMVEPKSSATILALAELADLSAKQLEDGNSIEKVIENLRAAALAVRSVIPAEEDNLDAEIEAADEAGNEGEMQSDLSA
ncbi:hypothetical protein [Roseibium algae]|uniref:Uncharacterized protein n=1 Tax=Roseibium algae TaxID=3123038 RepID=A0ABU8TL76_9HYPH